MKMTVGQALVKFLDQQHIKVDGLEQKLVHGVYTIFGHGNVVGLGQALEEDPGDLLVHQGCNEQGMGHIAMGFAKQKSRKKIYAVTSSIGPGSANLLTSAACATANRIPVLYLLGDTFATRQPDPVLQQVEQYYDGTLTTNDAFKPVSRFWDRVNRPEQLMTAMISAFRVLTDPADTGAVVICLPQDVQGEVHDFPDYFFQRRVHRLERRTPTKGMLEDAVELIIQKRKPMLVCGGGVRYSEAHTELRSFAEVFNIPFCETQAGKSAIPFDHPLNIGGVGTTGNLGANQIAKEADLVIGVGTRFTDFTTASKSLFRNKNVGFLTINVAEFDCYKMDAAPIVADAKSGLIALEKALRKVGYKSDYTDEVINAKRAWEEELSRVFNLKFGSNFIPEIEGHFENGLKEYRETLRTELCQTSVLGVMDKYFDHDGIVVGAAGSLPGDLQRMWRCKSRDTYHVEYGYSCMGYEINAAVGVKLACPNQEVYSMVGDGSFMMLHSEIQTAIQEGIKINIMLFDNAAYGCINNLQMGNGIPSFGTENRYRDPKTGELTGPLVMVDFAKVAEGYGCKTYSVNTEKKLIAAIKDAKRQTVTTLIDIKVLPKTMSKGYGAYWRVGTAQVAKRKETVAAAEQQRDVIKNRVRQY